jgi:Sulfatase-modifying factor enzyme 1
MYTIPCPSSPLSFYFITSLIYRWQGGGLELAIDCDKEAREIQPDVRAGLETLLKRGVEDLDPARQHVIAGALLARRLRQMVHLKDETYADTSLITCAEYQVFLDEEMQVRGRHLQPDHWTSHHFPHGQGNAPVLGVRSSDAAAFCAWLTEREVGPWQYRLPRAGELDDEAIPGRLFSPRFAPSSISFLLSISQGIQRNSMRFLSGWRRICIFDMSVFVHQFRFCRCIDER